MYCIMDLFAYRFEDFYLCNVYIYIIIHRYDYQSKIKYKIIFGRLQWSKLFFIVSMYMS